MQSGRKSDRISQNVTLVCIKVHSRMILKNADVFSDKGVNRLEMYVGVKLFRALYVSIALLYNSRLGTDNQPTGV